MKPVLDDTPWGVAHAWATKQDLARLEREHEVRLALRAAQARKREARRLRDQKKRSG